MVEALLQAHWEGNSRYRGQQALIIFNGSLVRPFRHFRIELPTYPLVAPSVKNLPAMPETSVPSLGLEDRLEDPLEEKMATHSTILAWEVPGQEAWRATVHGVTRVRHDLVTKPPT